jgi:hypothetical protein
MNESRPSYLVGDGGRSWLNKGKERYFLFNFILHLTLVLAQVTNQIGGKIQIIITPETIAILVILQIMTAKEVCYYI